MGLKWECFNLVVKSKNSYNFGHAKVYRFQATDDLGWKDERKEKRQEGKGLMEKERGTDWVTMRDGIEERNILYVNDP